MPCKLIELPEGATAIICGMKDHECNEDSMVLLLSGESDEYEVEDTPENRIKYENEIRGQSVACSICGTSAFSQCQF